MNRSSPPSTCSMGKYSARQFVRRVVVFVLLFVLGLYMIQERLIYFPHRYSKAVVEEAARHVSTLEFETGEGRQRAYYLAPPSGELRALWVCFNGNASTALDWVRFLESSGLGATGFLLIDYPGFGASSGSPSPKTILEASEKAYATLMQTLGEPQRSVELNVLGLSIGTGAALQFAAQHAVRRIVLLAPYTSLLAMAKRQVGVPLAYLLKHRFDNQARLVELRARNPRPDVVILHGDSDITVPTFMGRALAAENPGFVRYVEVPDCDHNWILQKAQNEIYAELRKGEAPST